MNYCDDAGDDWELFLHFDIVWPLFYVTSNEAAHPNGNQQEAHLRFLPFVFLKQKCVRVENVKKDKGPWHFSNSIVLHYR